MEYIFKPRKRFLFYVVISSIFIRFDFIHCELTG